MDLKDLNSYFKKDNISFINNYNGISIIKNNKKYKTSNKIQNKIKSLIGGKSSTSSTSKSISNSYTETNTFETKKFMSIQTWFNGDEQSKCVNTYKSGLKSTNPKFPYYKQMYYIASDKQDMEKYGILPIQLNFGKKNQKHQKEVDKELKSNIFKDELSIVSLPPLYKSFNITDIKDTFQYLYKKFQKGILVAIKDNKLVVYLPFYNDKFMNDYSSYIYVDDEDKKNMEELSKLIAKKSLSPQEKKRRGELSKITQKKIADFYKSKGEHLNGLIKERYKWLANDCMFVDRKKTDMRHGVPEYHYLFKECVSIFFPIYRHYSRVIIDIYFDHFSASNWDKYNSKNLKVFSNEFYDALKIESENFPENIKNFSRTLIFYNWFDSYKTITDLELILTQMAQRTRFPSKLSASKKQLKGNYTYFHNHFSSFMEEVIDFTKNEIKNL